MRFALGQDIRQTGLLGRLPWSRARGSLASLFCVLLVIPSVLAWWISYSEALRSHKDRVNEQHLLIAQRVAGEVNLLLTGAAEHFLTAVKNDLAPNAMLSSGRAGHFLQSCSIDASRAAPCALAMDHGRAGEIKLGQDRVLLAPVALVNGTPALIFEYRSGDTIARAAYATTEFQAFDARVSFGDNAHVAIFDHTGRILTLPNKQWVAEARDLSGVGAVRQALSGFEGVTNFYSPAFRSDMVAGVAQVGQLGWGVMVPQPMIELTRDARQIAWKTVLPMAAVLALLLAVIFALCLCAERRLQALSQALDALQAGDRDVRLAPHDRKLPFADASRLTPCFNNLAQAVHSLHRNLDEARDIARQEQHLRSATEKSAQHSRRESLERMTGALAHNFNNILNVALGHAEALQNHPEMERKAIENAANDIVAATQKGKALTKQMLSGNELAILTPAIIEPNSFATRFAKRITPTLSRDISLDLDLADPLPALWLDPDQLELALSQLVYNAQEAMSQGGRIGLEMRAIQTADHTQSVCILVQDTGDGMSPEDISCALEPFYSQKSLDRAVGMGLPMVAGFARQSGGSLRISSVPGAGTRVYLTFPAATDAAKKEPDIAGEEASQKAGNWRLLLVEDEPTLRRVLAERFRRTGCRVTEAEDGDQALSMLDKGTVFDAIVTDMVMPGEAQGDAVIRKARDKLGMVPIVLTSGYVPKLYEHDFENDPALSMVQKPAMSTEILSQILRLRSQL